jgi:uncharacterized membrane protein
MAKRRRSGGGRGRPAATKDTTARQPPLRGLDLALVALAGVGIALTVYLTGVAWFGARPAFCGAESGCDLVQTSRWSTFLGLPMALWGLVTYVVLARFLWRLRTRASAWRGALLVAAVGAAVSWYLTLVSVLDIEATCGWCLASFAIMNLTLVLVLLRRPAQMPEHRWSRALPAPVAIAGAVVLALHLHFSGLFDPAAGPEDPYLKALATHLEEEGALFYGAYWCPRCQEQKEIFTASAGRLPYVECSPQGRKGPVSLPCQDAEIREYPTWIIDGKRHTGVLDPSTLARATLFRGPSPAPGGR